ncbi:MAG: hypothetical protein RLP44_32155 [Aggregatilineales bacterium]
MRLLGTIKRVQIQRDPLKEGVAPNRVYSTDPLMVVDALKITPRGIFGQMMDGGEIIDVHHLDHPRSRNRENENGISFNFTSHYDQIINKFGKHISVGDAGENILIEATRTIEESDLGVRIAIKNARTDELLYLDGVRFAVPCVEFSYYLLDERAKGEIIKDTLQFVDQGTRGFYATYTGKQLDPIIHVGDKVYAID